MELYCLNFKYDGRIDYPDHMLINELLKRGVRRRRPALVHLRILLWRGEFFGRSLGTTCSGSGSGPGGGLGGLVVRVGGRTGGCISIKEYLGAPSPEYLGGPTSIKEAANALATCSSSSRSFKS